MTDGLTLRTLRISRGSDLLLALDFTIPPGEILTVMGPSGVGKSTLLNAISGHLAPPFSLAGQITLNGRDLTRLPAAERRIGILFQDHLLFPHLSVGGNLAFALPPGGGRAARRARVEAALSEIGLAGFFDRDPASLSGGQKARVALMRMLLAEPQLLLLDEAFSGLDRDLRQQIRGLVFAHAKARALPVLMVTHDPEDAAASSGPVLTLTPQAQF
ncbi:ATP-binding cassette domain-containing protein [Arenibacterium sp. LLYu02]|uniref:ATP-binding cassette domain-containing protein n=1 Tax=Arenibacterium sp. LLYu02 TaxID=3404132 RepID=UPI003B222031